MHLLSTFKDKIVNPKENLPPFWNLMATTPDTQLKRVAKTNLTVAKIVDGEYSLAFSKAILASEPLRIRPLKHRDPESRLLSI